MLISTQLLCQNIIENGDFETATPAAPAAWAFAPCCSVVEEADPWKDNIGQGIVHSPDRFNPCAGGVVLRDGSTTAPVINGADGCGYVGMFEHELFEQEVDGEKNDPYNLTFFVRLVANPYRIATNGDIGPLGSNVPYSYAANTAVLNILLGKNKIEYEGSGGEKKMNNNQIIEVATSVVTTIAAGIYPIGEWHQVSVPVSCAFDFNWIGFELAGQGYVLVDGISLTKLPGGCEACEEASCGPYDGCIDITAGNVHGIDDPNGQFTYWGIGNLEEVRKLRVKIWNAGGQSIIRDIEVFYPGSVWKFDGRDDLGNELPPGNYGYEIRCWNDCGAHTKLGGFTKANDSSTSTPNPNILMCYIPPEPCCESYIYINNATVADGGLFHIDCDTEIRALKGIFIGPSVEIDGNVTVTCVVGTDGEIKVLPGTSILSGGGVVELYLEDCSGFTGGGSTDDRGTNFEPMVSETPAIKDALIMPNPSNGRISIDLPDCMSGIYALVVRNSDGKIVHEEKINAGLSSFDMSGLGKGIFFVQARNEDYNFQKKLVIH